MRLRGLRALRALPLDALVASALGESLGRAISPVASAALYAMINAQGVISDSGGFLALTAATPVSFGTGSASTELAANTLHLDSLAQLQTGIDEAYLEAPDCAYYMSRTQWTGVIRQVSATDKKVQINPSDDGRSLWGFPVVLYVSDVRGGRLDCQWPRVRFALERCNAQDRSRVVWDASEYRKVRREPTDLLPLLAAWRRQGP